MRIKITTGKTCIEYQEETSEQPFALINKGRFLVRQAGPSRQAGDKHELFMRNLKELCDKAVEIEIARARDEV